MSDFKVGDVVYCRLLSGRVMEGAITGIENDTYRVENIVNGVRGWCYTKKVFQTFAEAENALLQKVQALEEV